MIRVDMQGRLGNQLFQYAFAKKIQIDTGERIIVNWELVNSQHKTEGDGWENSIKYFNVSFLDVFVSLSEAYKLSGKQSYILRIDEQLNKLHLMMKNRLKIKIKQPIFWKKLCESNGIYNFYNDFYPYRRTKEKRIFVKGYFESNEYYASIRDELIKEFTPKYARLEHNAELYRIIENSESICVSIRRGDFFSEKNKNNLGLCNKEYFEKGIEIIKEKYPNAIVILFSDDVEWAKRNLQIHGSVYSECGDDPVWEKIRLMYSCKHFVISNSTFSWWAQFLARNENKMIVAPKKWRTDGSGTELYEDSWILI